MTAPVPFLIQGKNILLVIDGKSHSVSKNTHLSYGNIVEALKNQDWDALRDLIEPKKAIVDFGAGNVSIEGDEVFWNGQPFHNALASRMIEMYKEGFPIEPMVRFMENLMDNPSKRSVDQVYSFLEKNSLPITEDGHFLAYKRVREDYLDIHSGTIDNSVGAYVTMERNQVDDNPNSLCSSGLHFCSESYLDHFGSSNQPVMILKINPADVVSIPADYNGTKGRACAYEVVAEVQGDPKSAFAAAVDTRFSSVDDIMHEDGDDPDDFVEIDEGPSWPFDSTPKFYDLVRVNGGIYEYYNLTEAEADAQIEANIRGKKAQLKKVPSGS